MSEEGRIAVAMRILRFGAAGALCVAVLEGDPGMTERHRVLMLACGLPGACLLAVNRFARPVSIVGAVAMAWIAEAYLRSGADWYALPVRNALFVIVLAALALIGTGEGKPSQKARW